MAYVGTYYAIGSTWIFSFVNYFAVGKSTNHVRGVVLGVDLPVGHDHSKHAVSQRESLLPPPFPHLTPPAQLIPPLS